MLIPKMGTVNAVASVVRHRIEHASRAVNFFIFQVVTMVAKVKATLASEMAWRMPDLTCSGHCLGRRIRRRDAMMGSS
jgi:hypothetical protein